MPRSNGGHVARSPSQGSLLDSNNLAFVEAKSYSDEGAAKSSADRDQVGTALSLGSERIQMPSGSGEVLTGVLAIPNVQGTISPSRPRALRKSLMTFGALLLMILIVSYLSLEDPMLLGTASPPMNFGSKPTTSMHAVREEMPNGFHNGFLQLDPLKWLGDNSHVDPTKLPGRQLVALQASRPKAALISLVSNSDAAAMAHTISQLEERFNSKKLHRYDWVFFNNEDFTEEFKAAVLNASSSCCFFERISKDHWVVPRWIDHATFAEARQLTGDIHTEKSRLESDHHKLRWNAGLFALESRLRNYEWYWRIEPGVQYTCNINYDIFRFMRDNDMAYGFNLALLDDARSFSSLLDRTKAFKLSHSNLVHPEADMSWALHMPLDSQDIIRSASTLAGYEILSVDEEHNHCQLFSNFEVGSLEYFRGQDHQTYFKHLDQSGGFYYEGYKDASVHTLSVNMFLPKRQVWYFHDIAYPPDSYQDCPPRVEKLAHGPEQDPKRVRAAELSASLRRRHKELDELRRHFAKEREAPSLYCGHTIGGLDRDNSRLISHETKQTRLLHTCNRLWLAGKWLSKAHAWLRPEEMALGGENSEDYLVEDFDTTLLQGDEFFLRIFQEWRPPIDNSETAFSTRLCSWLYFVVMIFIVARMA